MIDYKELLENYGFTRVTPRGDELNADCALCGDRARKFYLNTRKGVAVCFKGCFAGSIVSLVAQLEGVEHHEAERMVHAGGDWVNRIRRAFEPATRVDPRRVPFEWPRTRALNGTEINYLQRRRINIDLARAHGACGCDDMAGLVAGFKDCTRDDAVGLLALWPRKFEYLRNRILFPVYTDDGALMGAEARTATWSSLKTVYPENVNLKRTLFRSRGFGESDYVVVVEGIPDELTIENWGFPAASTFSSGISREQCAMLLAFARIYCAYDADKGGDIGLASIMSKTAGGAEVLHVQLPRGKDPNECVESEFVEAFVTARPVALN